MRTDDPLAPLVAAIDAAQRWLDDHDVASAVVGGVAASMHGRPRTTKDVDLVALFDLDDCAGLLEAAARYGIEPRHADAVEFARVTRVLLLRHAPSGVELDVSVGALPFERELVESSVVMEVTGLRFRVARPEDIIIMKALALRPRDVADIEGIVDAQPDLDLARVRRTVAEFSAALEQADLSSELERILAKMRRTT
jgi:predicted nucleotidyltransferase